MKSGVKGTSSIAKKKLAGKVHTKEEYAWTACLLENKKLESRQKSKE